MPYLFFNLIYFILLLLLSPVIFYRVVFLKKYRDGLAAKFLGQTPEFPALSDSHAKRIWLHAVSVGEVNLLKPLLRLLAEKHPEWECVISTTSATGFAVAQKNYGANYAVFYAPLDFSWAVRNALRRIKPDMLILAEQEIWPNLLFLCKRHNVRVALINGRLSEGGYKRYLLIRWLWRFVMQKIDIVCVQSETYSQWFQKLGAKKDSVYVTGSLKFDNAQTNRDNPATQKLRRLANISPNDIVFLAGSTQYPEEELAVETWLALREKHRNLRLILVPRHPERFDTVAEMLDKRLGNSPKHWLRRSLLRENADLSKDENYLPNEPPRQSAASNVSANLTTTAADCHPSKGGEFQDVTSLQLNKTTSNEITNNEITNNEIMNGETTNCVPILVDTVGELGAWWGTAKIAFVGGSMGTRGGQNMLEPAAYGAAVCFGANTKNFRDIVSLMLAENAAEIVRNGSELTQFVSRCLDNPTFTDQLGNNARQLVQRQLGATEKTVEMLEKTVDTVMPISSLRD